MDIDVFRPRYIVDHVRALGDVKMIQSYNYENAFSEMQGFIKKETMQTIIDGTLRSGYFINLQKNLGSIVETMGEEEVDKEEESAANQDKPSEVVTKGNNKGSKGKGKAAQAKSKKTPAKKEETTVAKNFTKLDFVHNECYANYGLDRFNNKSYVTMQDITMDKKGRHTGQLVSKQFQKELLENKSEQAEEEKPQAPTAKGKQSKSAAVSDLPFKFKSKSPTLIYKVTLYDNGGIFYILPIITEVKNCDQVIRMSFRDNLKDKYMIRKVISNGKVKILKAKTLTKTCTETYVNNATDYLSFIDNLKECSCISKEIQEINEKTCKCETEKCPCPKERKSCECQTDCICLEEKKCMCKSMPLYYSLISNMLDIDIYDEETKSYDYNMVKYMIETLKEKKYSGITSKIEPVLSYKVHFVVIDSVRGVSILDKLSQLIESDNEQAFLEKYKKSTYERLPSMTNGFNRVRN